MSAEPTISLCMIVKNEEEHLGGCLDNARPFVDEIIVVDTGSTDRTVEIALAAGAKVFHYPWRDDFAAARNESLAHANGEWVLTLDADERLASGSGELMRKLVREPGVVAYNVKLVCPTQHDRGMVRLGWFPRLFRTGVGASFEGIVHEQVTPSLAGKGDIRYSEITLDHTGYLKSPDEMHAKAERNIGLLERQIREDPQYSLGWFHLAETYSTVGRLDEAVGAYRKAIYLSVINDNTFSDGIAAVAYQNMGAVLLLQGRCDEGIAALEKALRLKPDLPGAHVSLGQAAFQKQEYETALERFRLAIEIARRAGEGGLPEFQVIPWFPWFLLGSAQAQLGQFEAALESFRRVVSLKPDFKDAHRLFGLTALKLGYPALAFEHLDAVRELGGDDAKLYVSLGSARGNLGDLEGAASEFRNALDRDPASEEARLNLCRAYRGLSRWDELLDEGRVLLEAGTEIPEIYRLLGEACAALEAWPQAVAMFESLLAVSSTPTREDLLNLAICRLGAGEAVEALETARRVTDLDPSAREPWLVVARCHRALGQMEAALVALERASVGSAGQLAGTIS